MVIIPITRDGIVCEKNTHSNTYEPTDMVILYIDALTLFDAQPI